MNIAIKSIFVHILFLIFGVTLVFISQSHLYIKTFYQTIFNLSILSIFIKFVFNRKVNVKSYGIDSLYWLAYWIGVASFLILSRLIITS